MYLSILTRTKFVSTLKHLLKIQKKIYEEKTQENFIFILFFSKEKRVSSG